MRRYALLGTNITESLSPALHARAFEALDMAASYDLWPCQDSDFEAQVERAREQLDAAGQVDAAGQLDATGLDAALDAAEIGARSDPGGTQYGAWGKEY